MRCAFSHIDGWIFPLSFVDFMQLKFLKDMKKGKVVTKNHSRGVAFVEFSEHEHALVALRVLNNNPGNVILKLFFFCNIGNQCLSSYLETIRLF